jgi:hypothetical protein
MTRPLTRLPAVALALFAAAVGAQAQPAPQSRDLPITTMDSSALSGLAQPERLVIQSMADLRAFYARTSLTLPAQPHVDFSTEDVLVAAMGTKATGGFGIRITKATAMTGGFTGGNCFVEVTETTPAPGTMVNMMVTSPIHVVRVPKGGAYHFTTVAPTPTVGPANALGSLDMTIADGFRGTSENLVLDHLGAVTLYRSSPTARYAPVTGTATAAEMQAVNAAFARADVATLPAVIPDPLMYIVQPPSLKLTSIIGPRTPAYTGVSRTFTTSATLGYYGASQARLEPLVAALRAISTRLQGPAFGGVHLTYSGGFILYNDDINVASDGTVTIVRNAAHMNPTLFFNGQATAAELQAISDATVAADVPSLPARIDDPHPIMDIPSLTIVATISGADTTVVVSKAGFYGTYEPRVRPMVDAVRAVYDRIVTNAPQSMTGLVTRTNGHTFVGSNEVPASDTLHRLIYAARGRTITILAHFYTLGGRQVLDVASVKGTTTPTNLNLRIGASASSSVVRTLARGTEVQISEVNPAGTWFKVSALGLDGWVSAQYVHVGQ